MLWWDNEGIIREFPETISVGIPVEIPGEIQEELLNKFPKKISRWIREKIRGENLEDISWVILSYLQKQHSMKSVKGVLKTNLWRNISKYPLEVIPERHLELRLN